MYASMPRGTQWSGLGDIPLFGKDVGGFVLRPEAFAGKGGVLCGYPYDPHTFNYVCIPPGLSDSCVPGCCCGGSNGAPAWVKGFIGEHSYFQDAYQPDDFGSLLSDYERRTNGDARGYNEIIVSQERWQARLPWSFDAFFFPATQQCRRNPECEAKTRRAHSAFLSEYPQSGIPLLTFNPADWQSPFAVADQVA